MLVILQQERKKNFWPKQQFPVVWAFFMCSVYGLLGCCGGWMCCGGVVVVDGHVEVAVDVCGGGDGGVVLWVEMW